MNSQIESDSSPCKFSSEEVLLKIFELTRFDGNLNNLPSSVSHMTALILTKLGLKKEWNEKTHSPLFKRKEVEEKNENSALFFKRKEEEISKPTVKFFTNVEAESQIEAILQSKEFQFDISSPRCKIFLFCLITILKNS